MRRFCLTAAFLAFAAAAFAHPHMSLESALSFEASPAGVKGFWVNWVFDPYFSASILQEQDANHDGSISPAESESIKRFAFDNLRKYGYFVFLRKGEQRSNPAAVEKFSASAKGGVLSYRFYVNLERKNLGNDFYVSIFDTTYYCAALYAKNPVEAKSAPGVLWERGQNKKFPVYYNPAGAATDFTVYKEWKPGLETAYPEEIHVHP